MDRRFRYIIVLCGVAALLVVSSVSQAALRSTGAASKSSRYRASHTHSSASIKPTRFRRVRSRSGHFRGGFRGRFHRGSRSRFSLGLAFPFSYGYGGWYGPQHYGRWETRQRQVFVEQPGTCYQPEHYVTSTDGTYIVYGTRMAERRCGEWRTIEERVRVW